MSDSVRSHRWQPTRLLCPWDSPGKNTGVCCHFLLQKQRNQRSNYKHPLAHRKKNKRISEKHVLLLYWVHKSLWLCGSQQWKILKAMGTPDHLTCLLRNLYAIQEAIIRTGHETTDWLPIGNGVHQGCILWPCLFHFCAEYIMWNVRLDEAQAGIKIARRNINNLRYADDTTLYGWQKA